MNNRTARVMPWALMLVLAFGGAAIAQESTLSSDTPQAESAGEEVDAKLKNAAAPAEEERLICRREKTIGTNRVTRVCRTAAEMRAQRESAQQELSTDNGRSTEASQPL